MPSFSFFRDLQKGGKNSAPIVTLNQINKVIKRGADLFFCGCNSIAAAGFVRRAGLRILFFGIVHCIGILLVIAFHDPRGAGRFFQTVKSFHGSGRLRAKPGMRALAGLQLGVIQLHRQPEQARSGKTKGAGTQKLEKGIHAAAPFLLLRGGRIFISTPFT